VKDYRFKLMADYPNSFMTKIFTAMRDPEVPDPPKDAKGNVIDSSFSYHYYKAHYWDYIDFNDERLLRTPILQNKIKTYTTQLTPQTPDSIIESVNLIIDKAEVNKEVFKYCVATLANAYETSNIMGFDKVFVDIAERYYLTDKAYWADDSLKKRIEERVNKIKPNILGTPAHDLVMPDTSLKMHRLYDVVADYTVLVFWDPTCSHCKKELPLLVAYYDSVKKAGLKLEVFAVGIESDIDLWKNYIKEHNLKWMNVSDLYNTTHFRNYYDIYSTPVIYLLDDKKRIIAKRLDTEKLRDFVDNYRKAQKP
jgi:thiol-disulfide isomerase/thioredoxin